MGKCAEILIIILIKIISIEIVCSKQKYNYIHFIRRKIKLYTYYTTGSVKSNDF